MNIEDRVSDSLFTHFIDKLDMTMCCGSDISGKELNEATSKYGLYFPLIQDEARSFREHVQATEYTSRSARFGPFIDNIVGMNWILPSGKRIKIGERVVKSTTGYDLFKFLLMTGGHFGYPSDYVIRLRPSCDASYCGKFMGTRESLKGVHQELRTSSWSQWVDEMDLIISADCEPYIEVTVCCQMSEKEYFFNYFDIIAAKHQSIFEETPENFIKELPWVTIKSLPSQTFNIAEDLVRNAGGVCRVLLINGVILINPANQNLARQMIYQMKMSLENQGGHIYGNGLDKHKNGSGDMEERWVTNLVRIWEKL